MAGNPLVWPFVWSEGLVSGRAQRIEMRALFRNLMPPSDDRTKTICKPL
jgi:hypothetical protein